MSYTFKFTKTALKDIEKHKSQEIGLYLKKNREAFIEASGASRDRFRPARNAEI